MDPTPEEVRILINRAEEAFWQVIADGFPTATHGDLSIDRTIAFSLIATEAVEEWIDNNVPLDRPTRYEV